MEEKYVPGSVWRAKCEHCGKIFMQRICSRGDTPRRYCNDTHRNSHKKAMRKYREQPLKCPHPEKRGYDDPVEAERWHRAIVFTHPEGWHNAPYACVCGKYHLGRSNAERIK